MKQWFFLRGATVFCCKNCPKIYLKRIKKVEEKILDTFGIIVYNDTSERQEGRSIRTFLPFFI